MLQAIHKELISRHAYLKHQKIESIYFGGGTPSLLSEKDISQLMETIHLMHTVSDEAEITLEANPDDLNQVYLQVLKAAGINRLSIGVQSFFNEDLHWMNRSHDADQAHQSIVEAQDIGFDNISIDLIYGLPGSDMPHWQSNVKRFLSYELAHLSCYGLTIEAGTVFGQWLKKKQMTETPDLEMEAQFYWMRSTLIEAGFKHYEISNLARKGYKAIHNTNYWKSIPYIGVGPSAHSFDGFSRQWNVANNALYIKALTESEPYFEREELDLTTQFNECVMLGLRTCWGIDRLVIGQLGENYLVFLDENISSFLDNGKIIRCENHYKLSAKSLMLADGIASTLFYLD